MENKDIDKAARECALKRYPEECGDDAYEAGLRTGYRNGYVDSHISRQSEIDELIEALEEVMRWIPVSEKLPEVDTEFLSLRDRCGFTTTHKLCKRTSLHDNECRRNLDTDGVTHWRPIDTPKVAQLLKRYENKKTIRVEKRKGFWWTALFWAVFFTVAPIQVVCFWIGRGFTILSDLLRELCYQAWFRSLDELE